MSYNYLPLDRKRTNFQQVKNLLDYNQLVSITFDAHERILKCREYLDHWLQSKNGQANNEQIAEQQYNLLKNNACATGEEAPAEIVKLMLMLKIKSLSFGHSGVQIETVKRLMEMYNNEVLPVIYTQGSAGVNGDAALLSHLSLPLIGLGEVNYKGEKRASTDVFNELNWQPVSLQSNEALALMSGTQFTTAYGIFALKKADQLLKFANIIAALSFAAFDCNINSLHKKLHSIKSYQEQINTADTLLHYLCESIDKHGNDSVADPYSFRCISQVHGAAKDTFNYVLNVFLQEINSVSDSVIILPDENLVVNSGNFHGQPLALASDFLCLFISELANISISRTHQLISGERGLPKYLSEDGRDEKYKAFEAIAAAIVNEMKQLLIPNSVNNVRLNDDEDFTSMSANTATKSLRLINSVEKVLAIELICAVQAIETKKILLNEGLLLQVVNAFRQNVSTSMKNIVLNDEIMKAVAFINFYKV